MSAASVPLVIVRCQKCNAAEIPLGRPRYWQKWPGTNVPHLIYSTRLKDLALTGCGRRWKWDIAALQRPHYLFSDHKPLPCPEILMHGNYGGYGKK